MVLNSFYPHDIRVRKEAETLIEAGYQVFLLCYKRRSEKKAEVRDGIQIHRVFIGESKVSVGIWDVISSIFFYHPIVGRILKKFIKQHSIDLLHVHDLPLAGTVLRVGKRHDIPVILDLHENYPEALSVWFSWRKNALIRLKNYLFFNYKRWHNYEKYAVKQSDRVIAVVDEMKQKLISDHDLPSEKITVISNTESCKFKEQQLNLNVYDDISDGFVLLYAGYIGPHRGVDTVINAMKYLKRYPSIYFVIVGSASEDVMSYLKESAIRNGNEQNIIFKGFQPFDTFYSYMSQASVNVIPHKKNGHTDFTIPHKIYQSMMAGKPVLVSSCEPLKRTVTRYQCGEVFEADNPADCANKIERIYHDQKAAAKMGQMGQRATLEGHLNWEQTGKELLTLYESITPDNG